MKRHKTCLLTLMGIVISAAPSGVAALDSAEVGTTPAFGQAVASVRIHLPAKATLLTQRIGDILASRIREYSGARAATSGEGKLHVHLSLRPGIGSEGFEIQSERAGTVSITGNDERGLLYGVGKFLHTSDFRTNGFTPSSWRGVSVPARPVRGIYLATHFHNYYEVAPIDEVKRYVEDLSLWGVNAYLVWFAVDAYNGINDPKAQVMLARLHALLKTVKDLGLDASLGCVANDGYANSPIELRAENNAGHNGYHKKMLVLGPELCPSKPGVLELELQYCEEKFTVFKDIGLDYWFIWPYDNGGCTCAKCAPYGINGYLKVAEPAARAFRKAFLKSKVILSGWNFDVFTDGEWAGLAQKFAQRPDWADYLIAGAGGFGSGVAEYPLKYGSPGGLPLLDFPEVSMYGQAPWGAYGCNPMPKRLQPQWDVSKDRLSGGFPYSEGIYEDINKVILAQFYWKRNGKASDAVREYISFYYSPSVVADVSRAISILEQNLGHRHEEKDGVTRIVMDNTSDADEAFQLVVQADKRLTPQARASWRWRILYLRALIDHELSRHQFRVSERCNAALVELRKIYHDTGETYESVGVPKRILGIVPDKP